MHYGHVAATITLAMSAPSKTADLATTKILINSILSTPGAKVVHSDLKAFYLGTPMNHYEYMRIPIHMIPDDIMALYNLHMD